MNEIEIKYKRKRTGQKVTCSRDAQKIFFETMDLDRLDVKEFFYVMYLTSNAEVIGVQKVAEGGITFTPVDVRLVIATALKSLSVGMILCHNHPSGKMKPSSEDKELTDKIKKSCEIMDIKLIDHLIISSEGNYYSFADESIL